MPPAAPIPPSQSGASTLRSGFVAIVGRPNAGKSTLLNRIVGQHLAITSPKAQSTRSRVVGLVSDASSQMVLLDTPGLITPGDALHHAMLGAARQALRDADVVVHLADARDGTPESVWSLAGWERTPPATPLIVALNKSDALDRAGRAELAGRAPDSLILSALTGEGVAELLDRIRSRLPHGPFLYPADDASAQDLRFFAAELVREAALEQLDEEVPHALACAIEEFRESRTPVYIRAVLYVERETQKRIVVGAGGARVREIGRAARTRIEPLVGRQVYLDLWVKVLPNWRRDAAALRRLGYAPVEERAR